MPIPRYVLSDFVEIQRKSFFDLLEKGLIEEFSKLNPIRNSKKTLELFFYPEYYKLTRPIYTPKTAILNGKSYTSKLYIPVQLTDKISKTIKLKWVCLGNLPLMTKRGHFILNGAPRVIVNQILRSPGIYYQQKIYENFKTKWSSQPDTIYKRYYADLICQRGTWLRLEIDKEKFLWAQMKKGPKIPIFWFLIAMGLTEKIIFNTLLDPTRLLGNIEKIDPNKPDQIIYKYVKNPPEAWAELYNLISNSSSTFSNKESKNSISRSVKKKNSSSDFSSKSASLSGDKFTAQSGLNLTNRNVALAGPSLEAAMKSVTTERIVEHQTDEKTIIENKNQRFLPSLDPLAAPFPVNSQAYESPGINKKKSNALLKQRADSQRSINFSIFSKPQILKSQPLNDSTLQTNFSELGRKWLFNKFMNPRTYDLGKLGRFNFNKKLGISISQNQWTLTAQDLLYATNNLLKVEKGLKKIDDIDHLKNRRVRTSGELLQIQIATGLVRLEKTVREKMNLQKNTSQFFLSTSRFKQTQQVKNKNTSLSLKKKQNMINSTIKSSLSSPSSALSFPVVSPKVQLMKETLTKKQPPLVRSNEVLTFAEKNKHKKTTELRRISNLKRFHFRIQNLNKINYTLKIFPSILKSSKHGKPSFVSESNNLQSSEYQISELINTKALNGALREFFGSSPLSQFMDQINPLSELTHKRRLSSMGPGGVTRDTATLAIRGIHPTHYGRICPVETPEGKNTGLVNSITAFARINSQGFLLSPFYKVYKGQVQKNAGMFYLSAEQEEKTKLAASDLFLSTAGFLPKGNLPVRITEEFTKIPRESIEYIGVSPIQMISIATSLIPFLEHDDANRALMGSNMQRQAVPLVRPERPIVGTGLESRAVSDSGHVLQSKYSGFVRYVSSNKIIVYSFLT
uniref:DNA-directed RNA polymerase n=1 Tax=Lobochlamys segnis TaxID=52035 RepID=A0A0S2IBX0_9CHLO|nr:beta subunit of RNA polymerase [Lobochlamys segnis]